MRSKDAFDELERLIERADHPFPIAKARSLLLSATARTPASDELARMIKRFNTSVQSLAQVLEDHPQLHPNYCRHDALVDINVLRRLCSDHR